MANSESFPPIFIVGAARSGTSIIYRAIFSSGENMVGHNEGHFFPILKGIMESVDSYYESKAHILGNPVNMVSQIPVAEVRMAMLKAVGQLADNLYKGKRWAEKTPDYKMIEVLPYLLEIWPDAKIIFAKRRGLECIDSRMRKFKAVPFETHCNIWSKTMISWHQLSKKLDGKYLEVDQRDIALKPLETGNSIADFIGLEKAETQRLCNVLANKRIQQTGNAEEESPKSIELMGWSDDEIKIFRQKCSKANELFGYVETSEYIKK